MSILFLVIDKKGKKLSEKTKNNLEAIKNNSEDIDIIFKTTDEFELLYKLKDKKVYDFVCLIPNNGELNENFQAIINEYKEKREEKIIYFPLVVLTSTEQKGVLNNVVWNSNLAEEVGILTHELAKKQVDTSLFGCLIPFDLFFDEENYNKDLKYYQHFYFLNKVTSDNNNVVFGIPKVILYTDINLNYSEVKHDEKIKYFQMAGIVN